jgi:hypothetical protein
MKAFVGRHIYREIKEVSVNILQLNSFMFNNK